MFYCCCCCQWQEWQYCRHHFFPFSLQFSAPFSLSCLSLPLTLLPFARHLLQVLLLPSALCYYLSSNETEQEGVIEESKGERERKIVRFPILILVICMERGNMRERERDKEWRRVTLHCVWIANDCLVRNERETLSERERKNDEIERGLKEKLNRGDWTSDFEKCWVIFWNSSFTNIIARFRESNEKSEGTRIKGGKKKNDLQVNFI